MTSSVDMLLNTHDYFALRAAFPELKFRLQCKRDNLYDYEKSWVIAEGKDELVDMMIDIFYKKEVQS